MSSAPYPLQLDPTRDDLLTPFGKKTLENQYLQPGETYQQLFGRVALAYGDDLAHSQRLYDYISRLWLMPATPILSNGGTARGLPISCFLNEAEDSLESIVALWTENAWLAARGGGIGSYWGNVRSINEKVSHNGTSSGIIPFIKVMESLSLAISQGSLRRGSAAAYLPISHPEIEEFIDMRKPTGGDYNRKALQLNHGVTVPDAFMQALAEDALWDLKSPSSGEIIKQISARELWAKLLTARIETGEPYIIFIDTVNESIPAHHKEKGLQVKMSNLCTEITLPTGLDYQGKTRTAVCCLSSVNVERFLEWKDQPQFLEDCLRFLDNVLSDFIAKAPPSMARAAYSAAQERSIGLGVMGFHSFLQSQNVPFDSAIAKSWNKNIFSHIHRQCQQISQKLAVERGPCPDAAACGQQERFSNKIAIAPNASTSIICGGTSPGIEPYVSNAYTHKTLSGSFPVRNKHLKRCLEAKGMDMPEVWSSIAQHEGSVQHLDFLTDHEKAVFRTAFEIDPRWIIDLAADRQPFICQSQSLNLFLPSNVHKRDLSALHFWGWKRKLKSFYYLRSRSIQRAESHMTSKEIFPLPPASSETALPLNYEECLSCQ